jgi:hypothetical protein
MLSNPANSFPVLVPPGRLAITSLSLKRNKVHRRGDEKPEEELAISSTSRQHMKEREDETMLCYTKVNIRETSNAMREMQKTLRENSR